MATRGIESRRYVVLILYNIFYTGAYMVDPTNPCRLCVVMDVLGLSGGNDIYHIRRAFTNQNFIVQVHMNLISHHIEELVDQYARIDHTNFYCFVCVILAPGNRHGDLCGADCSAIDTKSFVHTFSQVESLKNKPKVFFIQKNAGKYERKGGQRPTSLENNAIQYTAHDLPSDDIMVCSYCIDLNLPREHTSFFQEYELTTMKRDGADPLYFLVDEARTNYELQLEPDNAEFNFCCYDTFKYDLHLPLNREKVPVQVADNVSDSSTSFYPMASPIKGYCLIINNLGTEFQPDCNQLEEVFGNHFGFHTQLFTDLSVPVIEELFIALRSVDHSHHDAFVVVFFGKGGESKETIEGSGGKTIYIEDKFSYDNCLSLSSKPKIFMYGLERLNKANNVVSLNVADQSVNVSNHQCEPSNSQDVFRLLFDANEVNESQQRFAALFGDTIKTAAEGSTVTLDSIAKCTRNGCFSKPSGYCRQLILCIDRIKFNKGAMLAAQLQMIYSIWLKLRSSTIENIRQNREKLASVVRDVRISRIVGASVTLVGSVMMIVGFGLTPVTLGAAAALGGVGVGIAAIGGMTSVGATVVGKVIEKFGLRGINELLVIDQQMSQIMTTSIKAVEREADHLMVLNKDASKPEVLYGMLRAGEVFLKTGSKGIAVSGSVSVDSIGSCSVAVDLPTPSITNGQAVLEVIFLPISVLDLAVTAHRLAKQKNSSALMEIDELIKMLEGNYDSIKEYLTTPTTETKDTNSGELVGNLITSTRV